MWSLLFFDETATTKIYPYVPTLALHDALPIFQFYLAGISVSAGSACSSGSLKTSHVLRAMGWDDARAGEAVRVSFGPDTSEADVDRFVAAWRSEEHTSELQSLMRISYAVFCLKKKKNKHNLHKPKSMKSPLPDITT